MYETLTKYANFTRYLPQNIQNIFPRIFWGKCPSCPPSPPSPTLTTVYPQTVAHLSSNLAKDYRGLRSTAHNNKLCVMK